MERNALPSKNRCAHAAGFSLSQQGPTRTEAQQPQTSVVGGLVPMQKTEPTSLLLRTKFKDIEPQNVLDVQHDRIRDCIQID